MVVWLFWANCGILKPSKKADEEDRGASRLSFTWLLLSFWTSFLPALVSDEAAFRFGSSSVIPTNPANASEANIGDSPMALCMLGKLQRTRCRQFATCRSSESQSPRSRHRRAASCKTARAAAQVRLSESSKHHLSREISLSGKPQLRRVFCSRIRTELTAV